MKSKKINKKAPEKKEVKPTFFSTKPVLEIALKSLVLIGILCLALYYSDDKGYFDPDLINNHTKKKWDAFHQFTKHNNVDVLLLGNSHLYTGINPKNLSVTLAANSFILASPGTNIADTYYSLKEALEHTDPKLIVIETYGINDFDPFSLTKGALSDQFKSFNARPSSVGKLTSTPFLFSSNNYGYAWSNTIRNHEFIFNDTTQLQKNKALIIKKPKKKKNLYLGRYVRFQTGLSDSILAKYDSLGAPVNGSEYLTGGSAKKYVQKIVDLCENKNIELMFLTLPMYHSHVANYSKWSEKLGEILNPYPNDWINMQSPYDSSNFTADCFEDTYKTNQHMTYKGSLIATYKLANHIKSNVNLKLQNREKERRWTKNFYGEEGYFYNYPVAESDTANKLICSNFKTSNVLLKEVSVLKMSKGVNKILLAKVDTTGVDISTCKIRLRISFEEDKQLKVTNIDLAYDHFRRLNDQYNFHVTIKPIEVTQVKSGAIICK
jgi:hypothetical protein